VEADDRRRLLDLLHAIKAARRGEKHEHAGPE
jgi:hypothetical protein